MREGREEKKSFCWGEDELQGVKGDVVIVLKMSQSGSKFGRNCM